MMNEVSSDINRLERELTIYENSTHWIRLVKSNVFRDR